MLQWHSPGGMSYGASPIFLLHGNPYKTVLNIAQGDKDIFLKLFDNLKNNVKSNPDMLYKDYWK